jgi:hypothetical protein
VTSPEVLEEWGLERAVLRAAVPGVVGLECTFYNLLNNRTKHLRRRLYVAVAADGHEFRPREEQEHFPVTELVDYQMPDGLLGDEHAYGEGRPLEVALLCYSPAGSDAAAEAARLMGAALEELRKVSGWGERERDRFGWKHGMGHLRAMLAGKEGLVPAYRPPPGALPPRGVLPKPAPRPKPPTLEEVVRGNLERWGVLEDFDRMMKTNERKETA